ncbi:MAG: PilZ domain-containing protein [Porphyrobacter sp.]|nr:PilZ domain-containing protein [Porphyrobacter sp.]
MSFGRAASIPQERRAAPRTQVSCSARLRTCFGDRMGSLSDLSISGARFHTGEPPKEGTTALLEWEGHDAICRVVWSKSDACGLVFDRPIARHIVEKTAPPPVSAEPAAEVGKIPLGQRSSLRAGLVKRTGDDA